MQVNISIQVLKTLGERPNMEKVHNVDVAAGLVKLYLRELPVPLIPTKIFDSFVAIGGMALNYYSSYLILYITLKFTNLTTDSEMDNISLQLPPLKTLLSGLPKAHLNLLEALLRVLWIISQVISPLCPDIFRMHLRIQCPHQTWPLQLDLHYTAAQGTTLPK